MAYTTNSPIIQAARQELNRLPVHQRNEILSSDAKTHAFLLKVRDSLVMTMATQYGVNQATDIVSEAFDVSEAGAEGIGEGLDMFVDFIQNLFG